MKMTIEIHDAWLSRPEDLRRALALLAGLEDPPTGTGPADRPPDRREEPSEPEGRPRGAMGDTAGTTTGARRAAMTTTSTRRARRTRRPTGGSCWDGAPSRCPTPRAR